MRVLRRSGARAGDADAGACSPSVLPRLGAMARAISTVVARIASLHDWVCRTRSPCDCPPTTTSRSRYEESAVSRNAVMARGWSGDASADAPRWRRTPSRTSAALPQPWGPRQSRDQRAGSAAPRFGQPKAAPTTSPCTSARRHARWALGCRKIRREDSLLVRTASVLVAFLRTTGASGHGTRRNSHQTENEIVRMLRLNPEGPQAVCRSGAPGAVQSGGAR